METPGSGLSDDAVVALEFLSHTGQVDDGMGLSELCGWYTLTADGQRRGEAVIEELAQAGLLTRGWVELGAYSRGKEPSGCVTRSGRLRHPDCNGAPSHLPLTTVGSLLGFAR